MLRLALRFGVKPYRGFRWRPALVVVCTSASMALFLLAAGLMSAFSHQWQVLGERSFPLAGPQQRPDYWFTERPDVVTGQLFTVLWVSTSDDLPALPGLSDDLPPGGVAVSPALAAAVRRDPGLAARYPATSPVLDEAGLLTPDELFAVRRTVEPEILSHYPRALEGVHSDSPVKMDYATPRDPKPPMETTLTVALFVVMPGLAFAVLAGRLGAPTADVRIDRMRRVGASRGYLRRLVATEAAVVAVPGVLVGVVLWWLAFRSTSVVPVIGEGVFAGQLTPAQGSITLLAVAVLAITAFSAASRIREVDDGWEAIGRRTSRLRWFVVPAAGVVMAVGLVVPQEQRVLWLLSVTIAVVAALPWLLPWALRAVGAVMLAVNRSVTGLLIGRRLSLRSREWARPLVGLAVAAALVPPCVAFIALAESHDPIPAPTQTAVYEVKGPAVPTAADLDRLRALHPSANWAVVGQFRDGRIGVAVPCTGSAVMCRQAGDRVLRAVREAYWDDSIELRRQKDLADSHVVAVAARTAELDSALRNAAEQVYLAPIVWDTEHDSPRPSTLTPWLLSAMALTALSLVGLIVVGMLDRLMILARLTPTLLRLGVGRQRRARIEVTTTAISFTVCAGTGAALGTVGAVGLAASVTQIGVPYGAIAATWAVVLGAAAVFALWLGRKAAHGVENDLVADP